jgi:hypothetical protein
MSEQQNIDINSTTEIACEECGNNTFKPIFFMRKLSRFLSPDGNDRIIPIDSLSCAKCDHVNTNFNPISQLNNKKENE